MPLESDVFQDKPCRSSPENLVLLKGLKLFALWLCVAKFESAFVLSEPWNPLFSLITTTSRMLNQLLGINRL